MLPGGASASSPRENDDGAPGQHVGQFAEEALNSLVEEMKEMLVAPVYDMTPLQDVSEKFWSAMAEVRRQNARREERLEQSLAKIKAKFLMAREEHEELLFVERAGASPAPSPPARASRIQQENNHLGGMMGMRTWIPVTQLAQVATHERHLYQYCEK